MANFVYKRTDVTSMKIIGILDTDKMIVTIDEEEKELNTLLSDFNLGLVEISIKTKNEEELEEPTSIEE